MLKYSYYKKKDLRYLIALSYFRYLEYIKVSSRVKYNIYSPSNIEQAKVTTTKKKLVDK